MIRKCLLTLIAILLINNVTFANDAISTTEDFNNMTINLLDPSMRVTQLGVDFNVTYSQMGAFNEFINAIDKFKQSNIEVAYEDFKFILDNVETNDFGYTLIATKLSDYGFFYLSDLACKKMSDGDITKNHVDNIKTFYQPKTRLPYNEEIYLAEAYSNIMYNAQSKETMEELLKRSDLLEKFDYANYILALAAYKCNKLSVAQQYIQVAIQQNPQNVNYKVLQAQILADGLKPQEAVKVVEQIKKEHITEAELERRINSIEQYVSYKMAKKDWERDYHLGYYYLYEGQYNKAVKTLELALGKCKSKKSIADVNALLSKLYLERQDFEKAKKFAKIAERKNGGNADAQLVLGNLSYLHENYKDALKHYRKAESSEVTKIDAQTREGITLQKIGHERQAKETFEKILANSSTAYEAYYSVAMIEPFKQMIYLKKALSLNIMYVDAWLGLARYEISRDNFSKAQDYLSNAYYIDQNNFKYYYYQGLLYKSQDDYQTASMYFLKCLKLNPNCVEAQKELNL